MKALGSVPRAGSSLCPSACDRWGTITQQGRGENEGTTAIRTVGDAAGQGAPRLGAGPAFLHHTGKKSVTSLTMVTTPKGPF